MINTSNIANFTSKKTGTTGVLVVPCSLSRGNQHPPIFAQLQQLHQQFSYPNIDPNWQKSKKTRGVGWENVHKKLSYESNTLYLAYNIPLRLLYRSPPLTTLTSHYVHRNSGAHLTKTTTTASKEGNDQMEEDRSFFLPQTLGFWDLSRYNRINVIQHFPVLFSLLFFWLFVCFFILPSFSFRCFSCFFCFFVFSGHRLLLFFFYAAFYLLHKLLYKFCPWFNIEHL